jgi:rubredoxin
MAPFCNRSQLAILAVAAAALCENVISFAPVMSRQNLAFTQGSSKMTTHSKPTALQMSEPPQPEAPAAESTGPVDPMEAAMAEQEEKLARTATLREQEVFIQRSTGIHECNNCGFKYEASKGLKMIGEQIEPGTTFVELPSNWRCPTCRATKDSFTEITEEIPGFAVNQGYGLGGNSMTSGQKNGIIFGGLAVFFVLFISGYLLN